VPSSQANATIQDELKRQRARQVAFRANVTDAKGSSAGFLARLALSDITSGDDARIEKFYELYSAVFTLEEEREPIDGFRTVLDLNTDARVIKDFGPLREQVTVAQDPSGRIVGAANYILYAHDEAAARRYGYAVSSQLNFLCVDQNYRGAGIAQYLLEDLYRKVGLYAAEQGRAGAGFITCEQNNPARMTAEQLEEDMAAALIDPYERMRWWRARGFAKLDFDYCQPALNPGQEPCTYIDFFVRFVGGGANERRFLPAPPLIDHLRRYFFVSVGKFEQDMNRDPTWTRQRQALAVLSEVGIA
jgi:GNAT superfamily N-acetyltransferase